MGHFDYWAFLTRHGASLLLLLLETWGMNEMLAYFMNSPHYYDEKSLVLGGDSKESPPRLRSECARSESARAEFFSFILRNNR